jgi:hypothetical protein
MTLVSLPQREAVVLDPGVRLQLALVFPNANAKLRADAPMAQQPPEGEGLAQAGGAVGAVVRGDGDQAGDALGLVGSRHSREVILIRWGRRQARQQVAGPLEAEQVQGGANGREEQDETRQ